ncbi:hypothetical protein QBC36DRAFT_354449 [Triangularia setosa]|uniref:Uncharacterized protein n=1 Tax=Triangularia setosa TaxID=2587417 RepID=A0AAN6WEH3_9PEZI|nr:hypothetical protein QBC36DRAFT_354449 [Podospora setosa]
MSNDTREPKHRPEGVRRPQRKDSFSSVHSVLSWTGLQTKIGPKSAISTSSSSSNSTSSTATQHTTPASQGLLKPQRRHSHSFGTGWDSSNKDNSAKKRARPASMSRKLSFSGFMGIEDPTSAKARHAKPAFSTVDPKRSEESTKSGSKNGSSEKVNKTASEAAAKRLSQSSTLVGTVVRSKSPPPPTSIIIPKSILRVSSPDGGARRPRFLDPPGPGEQPHSPNLNAALLSPLPSPSTSPEQQQQQQQQQQPLSEKPPLSPPLTPLTSLLDSPPASPVLAPARTMSPSTVRFAKATVHRVEVGPGRRFLPVKRKSKSTITYVSPHDPGPQKTAPKTVLKSATKLRRHQENQKAMGRYWLRTEEEEAQWRAEAEARAQEEAERYRNEPSSPVQLTDIGSMEEVMAEGGVRRMEATERLESLDELSEGGGLGKLEEESEGSEEEEDSSSDSDDSEAGARCVEEVVITEVIDLTETLEEEDDDEKTVVGLPKAVEIPVEEVPAESSQASPTENPTPDHEENNPDVSEVGISLPDAPSPPQTSATSPLLKANTTSFTSFHSQLLSSEKEAAARRARRVAEQVHQSLLDEEAKRSPNVSKPIISVHLASHQTLKSPHFPAQLRAASPGGENPEINRRRLSQTRSTADLRTFKLPEPATGNGSGGGQSAMASVAMAVGNEIQRSTSPNNSLQLSRGRRERSRNRERGYLQTKKEVVV